MSLPITELSATSPSTDTNNTGRASASASGPLLPGDAADFAQAVQGASPAQTPLPGQAETIHATEPPATPQGRQLTQPPQPPANAASTAKAQHGTDSTDTTDDMGKTTKPDSRGDAILNALGGVATAEATSPPMVGTPTLGEVAGQGGLAEISGMDQRVLTQLVDSILVSAQEGKQEVHIKVQDAVLKDTTIVVRLQNGQLEVQLHTSDSYSSQLLHQNVDTLRHALESRHFGQPVQVQVEERDAPQEHQGQQGQQDKRSRGNFLWDQEE